jgi:hypothetical protein
MSRTPRRARRRTNLWFDNVEVVVARKVGSEPVRYVSNIVKYYLAYRLLAKTNPEAGA